MELLIVSFLAGILTVLAPCVVSILPILLARGVGDAKSRSAFWVIVGLCASIIIFSVLLKASTLLINVPTEFWRTVSGGIIIVFGVCTVWPGIWEAVTLRTRFVFGAQAVMGEAAKRRGVWGDILLGASLGPVFSACSPTYALVVATILPVQPLVGLVYLTAFVLGLALMLALIALFGTRIVRKLGWSLDPHGLFRRVLGIVLIVVGVLILTGLDKVLLGWLVEHGWYDFQIQLESQLQ